MSSVKSLKVTERDFSINPRQLRRDGSIPVTVYGKGVDSVSFVVDKKTFTQLYFEESPILLDLEFGDNLKRVLVKNVQIDSLSNEIISIQFQEVVEGQKLTFYVPLQIVGEAPAIKKGGTLWQLIDKIKISCLPKDIPLKIEFDVSSIESLDVSITVADITYPEGVSYKMDQTTAAIKVSPPRVVVAATSEATPAK